MQTFEKRGANFRNFTKRGANFKKIPISGPKLELLTQFLVKKLHDFEIICPARGLRSHPHYPLCIRAWNYVLEVNVGRFCLRFMFL